jgi:lipopolysaccharide transport system permease protein
VPYSLFALAGLVPWTFFANSVANSGNSLVTSSGLITKVYFPRVLLPIAAVAASCVDLLIAFLVLFAVMFYYRVIPGTGLVFLPFLTILMFLFASSVGMWMSALNVKYRDVRFALPFIIQLWLFVSSVIVPVSALPQKWRWILLLNPMASIIEGYRAALFSQRLDWFSLSSATIITLLVLVYSAYSFRQAERQFADII